MAEQLAGQHCLYACCGGVDSEAWHNAIDQVRPEEPLIVTTWHTDESINEVARFFVLDTWYENGKRPRNYLIMLVGSDPTVGDKLQKAVDRLLPLRNKR